MAKRIKYKIGDVFLVPLGDGLSTVGKVIKKSYSTVFVIIYKVIIFDGDSEINIHSLEDSEVVLMIWGYDTALKNGMWKIIGNCEVEENFEMPFFGTSDCTGKYYLVKGADTHHGTREFIQVTKDEAMKAYPFGITNEIALPKHCIYQFKKVNMI